MIDSHQIEPDFNCTWGKDLNDREKENDSDRSFNEKKDVR